jgi:hypothetical protein
LVSRSRLSQIPIDHLVAEVAAFPLASEAALRCRTIELERSDQGSAGRLWRETERHVLGHFPSFSVDEMVAVRDRVWFGERRRTNQPLPLVRYLRTVARLYLRREGDRVVPQLPDEEWQRRHGAALTGPLEAHARFAWRWLSFALPADLLLAALDGAHLPSSIHLLSPALDRMLRDRGYAETHVHLGCTISFPHLWVCALRALADPATKRERTFHSPGASLEEGRQLGPWLLSAAIARYVLAAYLSWGRPAGTLAQFLAGPIRPRVTRDIGAAAYALLALCLSELLRGEFQCDDYSFANRQGLYAHLTAVTARRFPKELAAIHSADPIAVFFPARGDSPTPEMGFIAAGLRHLELQLAGPPDPIFAILFWQVQRIRALFFRHVVQRPMTPGLQWFLRFYERMKAVSRIFSKEALFHSAARQGGQGFGLRSLEVRTAPDSSVWKLYKEIQAIDVAAAKYQHKEIQAIGHAPANYQDLEYGMVFHLVRNRGGGALKGEPTPHGLWSNADPDCRILPKPAGNPTGYRYAVVYQEKRKEVLAFAWMLRHYPLSLQIVRGLDLCTDEMGVPTWVFVPLIRHMQLAGQRASTYLRRFGLEVPPLRLTVHAGEDFVHLLTGLRHVDEVGRYLDLRQGSRIGHGLALGVDPREWARRAGRIPVACEERLFDLAWEWDWVAREGMNYSSCRRQFVEHEIVRLSEKVFGSPRLAPHDIGGLLDDLHDPAMLCRVGFPTGFPPGRKFLTKDHRLRWLHAYLTDPELFLRGRAIEWVDPDAEGPVLAELQCGIRRKFAEYGIAVEVNPTSNLLIGDLQDLGNHPLWRLRPPRGNGDSPPVSVCIGSDDPLTFATSLREEYQFLHDAMTLAGLSEEEARFWLEGVRSCGLENRFTVPRQGRWAINELRNIADAVVPLVP